METTDTCATISAGPTRLVVMGVAGCGKSSLGAALAAREMPGVDDAAQQLLSWNLHLAARAGAGRGTLLPSDIVFTEPPPAR